MTFSVKFKECLDATGMLPTKFAQLTGVSRVSVHRWVRGRTVPRRTVARVMLANLAPKHPAWADVLARELGTTLAKLNIALPAPATPPKPAPPANADVLLEAALFQFSEETGASPRELRRAVVTLLGRIDALSLTSADAAKLLAAPKPSLPPAPAAK